MSSVTSSGNNLTQLSCDSLTHPSTYVSSRAAEHTWGFSNTGLTPQRREGRRWSYYRSTSTSALSSSSTFQRSFSLPER